MVTLLLLFTLASTFPREILHIDQEFPFFLFCSISLRKEQLQKQLNFFTICYGWLLAEFYGECQPKRNLNFTNQGVQLKATRLV